MNSHTHDITHETDRENIQSTIPLEKPIINKKRELKEVAQKSDKTIPPQKRNKSKNVYNGSDGEPTTEKILKNQRRINILNSESLKKWANLIAVEKSWTERGR